MENKSTEKTEKLSKFASRLSQLRKERGISQKKAANDLGISQALLSHYEKGIRECGLDFVIRCKEYYGVTTDYLLGVSDSRNGVDLADLDNNCEGGETDFSTLIQATKYLLNLINVDNNRVKDFVLDYYTLCAYRGAITMAKAGILPKEMFKLEFTLGRELASAALAVEDAKFVFIEDKSRTGSDMFEETPLHKMIKRAEENILNTFILE
ncbi:MAG: helix-turn-helix domain-containing protein [Eubacterium sp.]